MRLGAYPCRLTPGSIAYSVYGTENISERHRHRFEFNNAYRDQYAAAGFVFAGTTPDDSLVEVIELPKHPFFIASQYHPEFLSKPNLPHPLFRGFIAAAHERLHAKPLPAQA
jgi:CTP synthase